jgi:hypothetical protein
MSGITITLSIVATARGVRLVEEPSLRLRLVCPACQAAPMAVLGMKAACPYPLQV